MDNVDVNESLTHTQAACMVACVYTLFAVGLVSRFVFLSPLLRLLLPQLSCQQFQHINQLDLAEPSGCFLSFLVRRQRSQTPGIMGPCAPGPCRVQVASAMGPWSPWSPRSQKIGKLSRIARQRHRRLRCPGGGMKI